MKYDSAALPATLTRRLMAMLYDSLLVVALWFIATAIVLPLNQGKAFQVGQAGYIWYIGWLFCVTALFFILFWLKAGQTLGMKTWRLYIQNSEGKPLHIRQLVIRFIGAIVSALCLGLGYGAIAIDPSRKAWHDRWSKTEIVLTHK